MLEPCWQRFTAAEGGARLASTVSSRNTLVTEYRSFIATRLLHEEAYSIRGSLSSGCQRSVRICRPVNVKPDAYELRILTDLEVAEATECDDVDDWSEELEAKEVLVCTSKVLKHILKEGVLTMCQINVLVIDSCHRIYEDGDLQYIMQVYKQQPHDKRPRILALTYPLFSATKKTIDNETSPENTVDNENAQENTTNNGTLRENTTDNEISERNDIENKTQENATDNETSEGNATDNEVSEDNITDCKVTEQNSTHNEICEQNSEDNVQIFEENNINDDIKVECNKNENKENKNDFNDLNVYENLDDFEMYEKLEWRIEHLENELCCKMDLAEDIDGCKRISGTMTKPKELIIEYGTRPGTDNLSEDYITLETFMSECANETLAFLEDHRYDPTEIYGEDLYEELKNIPDPTTEPKQIFKQFLYVLQELGPYAGDKAAITLLSKIEKSKIRVPYERHFLLLRLCTTTFVKIRCYAELIFDKYTNDWDKIRYFSTPKLLRFVDILENFSPVQKNEGSDKDTQNDGGFRKISKMIRDIDSCDFKSVGNRIEDKLNTMEANLKDLDLEGTKGTIKEDNRVYSRGRVRAAYTASALCALVFVSHALMARILFMLCADLSRCKASLSYLRSQYCAAEPSVEQKECQKQGKKQEEVLKKFRMHECNLLLTTSALEEGIDLPRCNLVLRWDVPASYRSYSLSRSRGRAARATAAMLCDPEHSNTTLHNLAVYTELDQIITRKCGCGIQDDPSQEEEAYADRFTSLVKAYTPNDTKTTPCNRKTSPCSCIKSSCRTSTCICKKSSCICKPSPCICKKLFCSCKPSSCTCKTSSCTCSNKDELRKTTACVTKNESDANRNNDFRKNETSEINDCDETCESEINDFSEINDSEREINDVIETNESKTNNLCELLKNSNLNSENVVSNELCDSKTNECSKNIKSNAVGSTLSENIKNMRISKSLDSDKKCLCQNLEKAEHASVDLSTAIALINRYCAKLPSDTFTRLAPQWWIERVRLPTDKRHSYICTLRLPLNCPLKYNIVGHPMPTRVLARRMAALQACRILHKAGELDDQLMPIGKENFKAAELTTMNSYSVVINEREVDDFARPGTTKRRQYYYKRTASAFKNCQPVVDISDSELDPTANMESEQTDKIATDGVNKRNMLFAIECSLCCALPERYNTRGRRLHAPQHAASALAVLMGGTELTHMQIPSFPVYTRSGEVRVSVRHVPHADVTLSTRRNELVTRFMSFVFSDVLRVRRRGMTLQPEGSTKNNYYIVPTVKLQKEDGTTQLDIDWPFLELIYKYTEDQRLSDVDKPMPWYQKKDCNGDGDGGDEGDGGKRGDEKGEILDNPLLKKGEVFVFDVDRYREAVVTPWYRNQDQPQFFLVAEICWNLTPDSAFPSESHSSFRSYYRAKYKVNLTQSDQPLLDVDHTSARLNLLTPRYVNRKGVALPVSSERTRRAKRDRLDQKQILVPELCRVHPFAAPLWFATVALPCVLYRINALLIADEIRRAVAIDVGLGIPTVDENTMPGFNWPPLDFGWSLSEVLNADAEKNEKKKEEDREKEKERREKEVRELEVKKQSEVIEESIEEEIPMKTINDILQEKEDAESGFEIGTWSNDMASSIPDNSFDEYLEPLPPNLTLCTSASGGVNWCESVQKPQGRYTPGRVYSVADSDCSYISSDFDTDDSDFEDEESDEDTDVSGFCSSRTRNNAVGVRIEYKTAHEAEAVDVERKRKTHPAPERDVVADRQDMEDMMALLQTGVAGDHYITKFNQSVENHKKNIVKNKQLILKDTPIVDLRPDVVETRDNSTVIATPIEKLPEIFPRRDKIDIVDGQITIESIEKNKRVLLADLRDSLVSEEIKKLNCFSMVDVDIDSPDYVNEKIANIGFDSKETYEEKLANFDRRQFKPYYDENRGRSGKEYDFDYQPDLEGHPGPSPSVILQALTMSNANDGINLERLETIGDSFLKFAITAFLYCAHPTVHEGKLSHMRSKQVSNLNLYRLGRAKRLGARMIASKFEPHDNWLPPCHRPPPGPATQHGMTDTEDGHTSTPLPDSTTGCYIPYNLITQHSIPDKSIADCVEALIGAYLLECGPRGALLFMSWLGISVLPRHAIMLPRAQDTGDGVGQKCPKTSHKRKKTIRKRTASASSTSTREGSDGTDSEWDEMGRDWDEFVGPVGARRPFRDADGNWIQIVYGELKAPPSPLLRYIENPEGELEQMLSGYEALENTLQYRFRDRSLLLQALTHASHQRNRLTDCYQRLEFLGDAILDYLITRHLYEDPRRHCPGALTDLRSALVNNTIFATLAVRHGFHKYFRHMSPGLNEVLTKYVKIQEENGHSISEEHYLIQEDELEQAEDVEVPKALGDLFESVAGAIFLDAGMSLGAVWQSYVRLMGAELEAFSAAAPKSPVRELLEAEPDTAKFGKPERLADGRRVRVCVEVFGRGTFKGIGRNYRIAKGTAARCALRHLKGLTR